MPHRTRLAPSPTGALHLGNARTFLVNWAMARQHGWQVILRIEDLDGPRVKSGAAKQAINQLQWLGIDWDEGPIYQSHDLQPYRDAMRALAAGGNAYPCNCTRSEIEAASRSAPHGDLHELRYSGACRPVQPAPIDLTADDLQSQGWRLRVEPGAATFVDQFAGPQQMDVSQTVGDFQVWTKGDAPSYQLAVTVDDARQGIDRIVRGNDLLGSTPRQQMIAQHLQLDYVPEYWHLPLVRGEDGRRLAKRHGDTRLETYRQQGVPPERVVGLLGSWCGLGEQYNMSAREFAAALDLQAISTDDVVFRATDDAWLRAS